MASMIPISHDLLKERLRKGAVKFFFKKVGGDLRSAMGTLQMSRIPVSGIPRGGKAPAGVTPYFDLEKNQWRSVSHSKEIWVEA